MYNLTVMKCSYFGKIQVVGDFNKGVQTQLDDNLKFRTWDLCDCSQQRKNSSKLPHVFFCLGSSKLASNCIRVDSFQFSKSAQLLLSNFFTHINRASNGELDHRIGTFSLTYMLDFTGDCFSRPNISILCCISKKKESFVKIWCVSSKRCGSGLLLH